ncbi:MAG TPA: glycosyltransferase [Candidatus Paceibacterota bacterium]|nr:glycosyltransferase [Candidatus Paceibacterota bacterium]
MQKIPKIIHYVWVGNKPKDDLFHACFKSWQEHLPDYKIMEWNEKTFDIKKHFQVQKALEQNNYAYASDIIRVWALKEHGGVYFDTDMFITKNIDHLLKYDLFLSYEAKHWLGSAIVGSVKNHPTLNLIYARYDTKDEINFNTNALTVHAYTAALKNLYNFKPNGKKQEFNNILILPSEYFYPINYMTLKKETTDNTLGIHYYKGSWHTEEQLKGFNFAKTSRKILGKHIFSFFEKIVANNYNRKLQKDFRKIQNKQ